MKTKTALQILDETVRYYTKDINRRATTPNGCRILTTDGRTCAVGRCMLKEKQREFLGSAGPRTGIIRTNSPALDAMLKPTYRGHTEAFWCRLQALHDSNITVEQFKLAATILRNDILANPTHFTPAP